MFKEANHNFRSPEAKMTDKLIYKPWPGDLEERPTSARCLQLECDGRDVFGAHSLVTIIDKEHHYNAMNGIVIGSHGNNYLVQIQENGGATWVKHVNVKHLPLK